MTNHGHRTSSEHQRWLRWHLGTMLMGILALNGGEAHAQSMNVDIERGAHPAHVSAEDHGAYLTYDVKASGDTSLSCAEYTPSGPCKTLTASDDAHTVTYAVETTWRSYDDYNRPGGSGLPSRTEGAINARTSRTSGAIRGDNWYWTRREGPISPTEERPLLATMTLVSSEAGTGIGTNKTLQWAVNPQFTLVPQSTTVSEGTDTHAIFAVFLDPPALGNDHRAVRNLRRLSDGRKRLHGYVGDVDVCRWRQREADSGSDHAVSDSGENFTMTLSNPSGATRILLTEGGVAFVDRLTYSITILNDEPGDNPNSDDVSLVTITAESGSVAEGADAVFKLTRTGNTDDALTVTLAVAETGAMLSDSLPTSATFTAGKSDTELRVATVGDEADEDDSTLTVTLASGEGYRLGNNNQSEASATILDDDAAALPGGTVAVAGTVVWTADMTVTDYGNGSVDREPACEPARQRGPASTAPLLPHRRAQAPHGIHKQCRHRLSHACRRQRQAGVSRGAIRRLELHLERRQRRLDG